MTIIPCHTRRRLFRHLFTISPVLVTTTFHRLRGKTRPQHPPDDLHRHENEHGQTHNLMPVPKMLQPHTPDRRHRQRERHHGQKQRERVIILMDFKPQSFRGDKITQYRRGDRQRRQYAPGDKSGKAVRRPLGTEFWLRHGNLSTFKIEFESPTSDVMRQRERVAIRVEKIVQPRDVHGYFVARVVQKFRKGQYGGFVDVSDAGVDESLVRVG
mmetsp:Transcript_52016/g.62590  ORF Transcript_52016/g.62590 Transcript_52016/m.62590 type:complete len:213 (+) Transcript_52016:406-1044(+)